MRPVSSPMAMIEPEPNRATVIFVRPPSYPFHVSPIVVDERGGLMGAAENKKFFVSKLVPGRHLFFVLGENTGSLVADVLPGRVYFVEVSVGLGLISPRAHLLAIAPRTPQWSKLREWLREAEPRDPDFVKGNAYLAELEWAMDVRGRIRSAGDAFGWLDEAERDKRTLRPEDGLVQGFTR